MIISVETASSLSPVVNKPFLDSATLCDVIKPGGDHVDPDDEPYRDALGADTDTTYMPDQLRFFQPAYVPRTIEMKSTGPN